MKMNKGGLVLTGVGAYLILSKAIRLIDRSIENLSSAIKWRAYYKAFAETGRTDMKEPEARQEESKSTESEEKTETKKKPDASTEALRDALKDVITKSIDNLFGVKEEPEEASEGQIEQSPKQFLEMVNECYEKGMTEEELAKAMAISIEELQKKITDAKDALETSTETAEEKDIPTIHVVKDEANENLD